MVFFLCFQQVAELEASSTELPALQRQVQEQGNRVTELETKLGETTSSLETSQEELRVFRERVETLSAERDSLLQSQTELQTTLSKAVCAAFLAVSVSLCVNYFASMSFFFACDLVSVRVCSRYAGEFAGVRLTVYLNELCTVCIHVYVFLQGKHSCH